MDASDRTLLTRYRRGDIEALEALINKYRRPLYSVIIGMTQGRDEADDVFQEVWLKVIRKHGKYRHGNFCGWLIRIAHNVVIDRSRRKKPEVSLDKEHDEGFSLVQVLPGNEPPPAKRIETRDLKDKMARAVGTLPAEQKEVFLMRVQAELSFKEIARIQKVSINTALARMQYALAKLRVILEDDYKILKGTA
jgi:RNA polymerase sigma-70 factor (ECF subfamily)